MNQKSEVTTLLPCLNSIIGSTGMHRL